MKKTRYMAVKRTHIPVWMKIVNPVVFVILALAFCGIFMAFQGFNPFLIYAKMFKSAFGSWNGWSKSILTGIPFILCGLGVSIAFKMNLNNIGAEGQYAVGAIAAAGFVLFVDCPTWLQVPMMILLSLAAGALWALIAAVLKAYWGINETIVTLLLNYVALNLLDYLCRGPWKAGGTLSLPYSENIPDTAKLPMIFGGSISVGFIVAIVMAVIMFLFFKYTTTGYQVSVIKNSLKAAKYAGINVKRNILVVLGISGAIAGLTGAIQVESTLYRLQPELPGGAGFTGIVIAYLSKFNPLVVILVGIFFGGLEKGGYAVQIQGVPVQVADMITGAILVFVLAGEFFNNYKMHKLGSDADDK